MMTRVQINDWRQRTIEAEENYAAGVSRGELYLEGYTQQDQNDAAGWPGCAVGEVFRKSSKKVRLIVGAGWEGQLTEPKDRVLARLGGRFSDVINANDFLRAYELIDLIEARVLHLRAKKEICLCHGSLTLHG